MNRTYWKILVEKRKSKMIKSIKLKNFRRHEDLSVDLNKTFNLIHGKNNAGKTTIFYAIEYALFGMVRGFKSIAQLTRYEQNNVGVELIFKGNDDGIYKLQRMHKLKGKSRAANGFFTLKKILSKDKEKYILATDFGDTEGDLSLKINELLGISKRLFEAGIHFSQGEISKILMGDKKLDIVFGIKTATALANAFRERALDFEKEVKVIDTFKATLSHSEKEKAEYQKKLENQKQNQEKISVKISRKNNDLRKLENFKNFSERISDSVKSFEDIEKQINDTKIKEEMILKDIKENKEKYGSEAELITKKDNLEKDLKDFKRKENKLDEKITSIQKKIRENETQKVKKESLNKQKQKLQNDLDSFIKKYGKKEDLQDKVKTDKDNLEKIRNKIKELEILQIDLQNSIRNNEREKGDIEGILKRREMNKDNQTCEYCGAPIDASKILKEIEDCKKKLKDLEEDLNKQEQEKEKIKRSLLKLRSEEKTHYEEEIKLNNLLNKINEMGDTLNSSFKEDIDKKIIELNEIIEKQINLLDNIKKELNSIREDQNQISKKLNEVKTFLNQKKEFERKLTTIQEEKIKSEQFFNQQKAVLSENFKNLKKELKESLETVESSNNFIASLEIILKKINDYEKDKNLENALLIRDELKEAIISKISEISTTINHLKKQKEQSSKDLEETKKQIKRLDKQIAQTERKIHILNIKDNLAEKYRNYQQIFKDTQKIIRNNVSKTLEEDILKSYRLFSSEDEFEKISIDNKDYSLSVIPKGTESRIYYPASVYEGGGYQLILGLSYKFALNKIIGNSTFLLIDEPTEFIDENNRKILLSNISTISDSTQVILITHQDIDKIQCNNKIEIKKI